MATSDERLVQIHLTKVETGETRIHVDEPCEYLWTDGNYGCDCNRALFFERAGGDGADEEDDECGVGRFSAKYYLDDGTEVSLDD